MLRKLGQECPPPHLASGTLDFGPWAGTVVPTWRRFPWAASISFHLIAAFVASRGIGQYIRQHFLDTTFKGLYHPNSFDMALLIPYFIVLILLASYGMHRYVLVYLYYKHKNNRTTDPPGHFADLPRVTVQLPIFNEQFVVERLVDAICRLQYPIEKLDVQVLDDSTDETQAVAQGLVEHYAALRFSDHLPSPQQS